MGCVIELILTIVAWRRGWRWKALIPLAIGLAIGMVIGVLVAAAGHRSPPDEVKVLGFLLDLVVIIVLAVMIKKPPEPKLPSISG